MRRKRSRSRSREQPAQPARRRRLPSPTEPKVTPLAGMMKIGYLAARRTGRLRGQALRRPGTPPPPSEKRAAFRASPSPEPAEEQRQPAPPPTTSMEERRRDGGRRRREKAFYLVVQEQGHGAAVSGYAVHRVDLARSRHGISVSGEALDEPPVARFKAAPGMAFFKSGSEKIVGVTDKDAGVIEAESVVIDAGTWEVSAGPTPSSTEYGLVEVAGKIYAADMLTEDPRFEVLRSVNASARCRWSPLPRPPFRDRILTFAAYPPRRGLLVSTDKGETYLLDRRRRGGSAWVALPGSAAPLPFEERAVFAKENGLWFEVSPTGGRLRAHDLDVVVRGAPGAPRLEHTTHRVSDPIPVITPSACGGRTPSAKLVYLGSGNFCVAQAAAERGGGRAGGCHVTVTMFRVIDSETRVTLAERRRRRRERGMNARWVAAELERACMDEASRSGRRRRKLCRVNLWSRTYIVDGGDGHGASLAGLLWM